MKRIVTLLLCVILLLGCGTAFGCEKPEEPVLDGSTADGTVELTETDLPKPPVLTLSEGGATAYKVICSDEASSAVAELVLGLCFDLSESSGASFEGSSDFVMPGTDPDGVNEYEILIGGTNRSADDSALADAGNGGWCVLVQEKRIIIDAFTSSALTEAIAYFKSVLSVEDGKLVFDTAFTKVEYRHRELRDMTLRVGSYNIKHGGDVGLDFSVIAADIKALDLDVIGFQEIDKCTKRVKGMDTPKEIAEALGYKYYYFTKAISFQGGEYGTLIVSRYPIASEESVAFPVHSGYEARAMGHVVIDVDGILVNFYNTHLSYEKKTLIKEQFEVLSGVIDGVQGFIVTGDFNTADLSYFASIGNSHLVNPGRYVTFPSSESCIDNIILESGWQIVDSGVGPAGHSDHKLLWAEIRYAEWEE